MTFDELYHTLLKNTVEPHPEPLYSCDHRQLDCLLHPEKYPAVLQIDNKGCIDCNYERACEQSCIFDAITHGEDGRLTIDAAACVGCGACIDACKSKKLTQSRDILPAMKAVRETKRPSYALIAPAFIGQFQENVNPGKLRSAFQALGFTGMIEVALFADILTMKEALEFDRHIHHDGDFQLTSCCCPIWIAMIRKVYHELIPHVPGAVSPMAACGRVVKKLHKDALTVFIGPCIAKKSEAKEPDIADAIDYVLTFEEVRDIFDAAGIDPAVMPEREKEHSSRAGRIYAHTGGVSEAVYRTLRQLDPNKASIFKARQADGVPACRAMIEDIRCGKLKGNFFEGMGCVGGCVGGPKAIIDREKGRAHASQYGQEAPYATPLENPYVIELLKRLGIHSVEELLNEDPLFTRDFNV